MDKKAATRDGLSDPTIQPSNHPFLHSSIAPPIHPYPLPSSHAAGWIASIGRLQHTGASAPGPRRMTTIWAPQTGQWKAL